MDGYVEYAERLRLQQACLVYNMLHFNDTGHSVKSGAFEVNSLKMFLSHFSPIYTYVTLNCLVIIHILKC